MWEMFSSVSKVKKQNKWMFTDEQTKMSYFPVRCYTCGKVLGTLYDTYVKNIDEVGLSETMARMKLTRYCCRAVVMGYVNLETYTISEARTDLIEDK